MRGYLIFLILFFFVAIAPALAWSPPIGIPYPPIGIDDTHLMYRLQPGESCITHPKKCYDYGQGLVPYLEAEDGPYTHYIKPGTGCTNTSNPRGTKEKPRCQLPSSTVTAGSVVEVHGTISRDNHAHYELVATGEPDRPIFLRGVSNGARPVYQSLGIKIRGRYVIVENFDFVSTGPSIRPVQVTDEVHHVALRNSELRGSGAGTSAVSFLDGKYAEQIVFYSNKIHADDFDPNGMPFPENDTCGIYLSPRSRYVWILDNDIYGFSGDAVGGGHGANYTTGNYYIGRNKLHDTGENGIDLKEVENIVISQNEMYNFTGLSSGSDGTATVVHYGPTYSPKNVWFLYNHIHDALDVGLQVGGSQLYDVMYVGNIVRNIHNANGNAWGYKTWSSQKVYLLNNLFYDVDNGIYSQVDGAGSHIYFHNNIVAKVKEGGFHLTLSGSSKSNLANTANFSSNIFYRAGGTPKISWGGVNMTTLQTTSPIYNVTDFIRVSGSCGGCKESDPLFVDPGNLNFNLASASPAADVGDQSLMSTLSQRYKEKFGLELNLDYSLNNRIHNVAIDIGPLEWHSSLSFVPRAPSNLRAH